MTTKAEWFRYAEERTHPRGQAAPKPRAGKPAPRKEEGPTRKARAATYALEEGAARPSRKSTRKSANRQKTDVQYRLKRREGEARPRNPT